MDSIGMLIETKGSCSGWISRRLIWDLQLARGKRRLLLWKYHVPVPCSHSWRIPTSPHNNHRAIAAREVQRHGAEVPLPASATSSTSQIIRTSKWVKRVLQSVHERQRPKNPTAITLPHPISYIRPPLSLLGGDTSKETSLFPDGGVYLVSLPSSDEESRSQRSRRGLRGFSSEEKAEVRMTLLGYYDCPPVR